MYRTSERTLEPRIRTHWEDCYTNMMHHDCAIAYIKDLESKIELLEYRIHELEDELTRTK
jgi:hypothetical protein